MDQPRITNSARKHRIGNAHIIAALANAGAPTVDGDALIYVGLDDRGIEIEIVSVPNDRGEGLVIIHAMPTHYRRN